MKTKRTNDSSRLRNKLKWRGYALITALLFWSPGAVTALVAQTNYLDSAWDVKRVQAVLDRSQHLHLAADLTTMSAAEQQAVPLLLEVGELLHDIYLDSRHPEALSARKTLMDLQMNPVSSEHSTALLKLFRLMRGPIATTFDNRREPFLPVSSETAGKNVYPPGVTREQLDSVLQSNPQRRRTLLHLRSVVRRAEHGNLDRDLAVLNRYPVIEVLHPGYRKHLERVRQAPVVWQYYAVPYSVAYADRIMSVYDLLNQTADILQEGDAAFAQYLRHRSRDLLCDDYEAGDAAWVTGMFTGNLNAQIGSYETYDDALYGIKSFFAMSLLMRDKERSDELAAGIAGIQAIQDALPYKTERKVREVIPVGVYNIIADFGQARGTNTATILPNESHLSRQYGRTILIRANILTNPQVFSMRQAGFKAAINRLQHDDLKIEGNLYRTLWHEIGHYLGVDRSRDGRELDETLQETSGLIEELKSDLVSLFAAHYLWQQGLHSDARLRAIYASGIRRVLQMSRPRPAQAYQTMQLMQWNWFLKHGVLSFNRADGLLRINYNNYIAAVTAMLADVLRLQHLGDHVSAQAFIRQWTSWEEDLHRVIAGKMSAAAKYGYNFVTYEALDTP